MNCKKTIEFGILTISLLTIGSSLVIYSPIDAEKNGDLKIKSLGEDMKQRNDCQDEKTDCENLFDDGDGFDVWNLGYGNLESTLDREIMQINECSAGATCGNMIQSEFTLAEGPLDK